MIRISGRRALDRALRNSIAVLLAVAAQLSRLCLADPTSIPFITYVPFMLMGGALGGLTPGLLATALCCAEALYFATPPVGSFTMEQPDHWLGLATLALTGIIASVLFELLIRARRAALGAAQTRAELAREVETRQAMLESMIRNSPAAMALLDGPDFTIHMFNPAYQALAPGESMAGRTVSQVWPEVAAQTLALLNRVRTSGLASHHTAFPMQLHRGPGLPPEPRYFDFSFVPLPDTAVLAVFIEVTGHKHAQESLKLANSELTAVYDNAPVMLLVVDDQLRVEKANRLAGPVGQGPGDTLGCLNRCESPLGCGHGPQCGSCTVRAAILDSLLHGTLHTNVEGSLPVTGDRGRQYRALLVSTARMQLDGVTKVLVCAQDITSLKTSQRQLEAALAEKTVLLQEIHHRVKNNLAVISSLLGMKADSTESPEARAALERSCQRVHSMALIHELLYSNDRLDRVDFSEYARQLVHGFESDRISISLDLAPVELNIERAVPCALILNELLTNAFKYAFPGDRPGDIRIGFHQSAPGALQLIVEDNGIGFAASPNGKSLGLRIVQILTRQLDGSLEQSAPPGTRLTLTIPA